MDFNAIGQAITQLGFPVFCVVGLAWFTNKQLTEQREETNKREEQYQKQIASFSISLDKFNETLIKIDTRLEVLEKK